MRTLLLITAASLFAIACENDGADDVDMPSGEEIEQNTEEAVDATGEALEEAGEAIEDAAVRAGEEMDEMGEDMPIRDVNGRWGITSGACTMDNEQRDGVVVISRYTVAMGLDECSIQGVETTPDGYTHFMTQCESAEGDADYERDFYVRREGDRLMVDQRDMGRAEEYVLCDMDDER